MLILLAIVAVVCCKMCRFLGRFLYVGWEAIDTKKIYLWKKGRREGPFMVLWLLLHLCLIWIFWIVNLNCRKRFCSVSYCQILHIWWVFVLNNLKVVFSYLLVHQTWVDVSMPFCIANCCMSNNLANVAKYYHLCIFVLPRGDLKKWEDHYELDYEPFSNFLPVLVFGIPKQSCMEAWNQYSWIDF